MSEKDAQQIVKETAKQTADQIHEAMKKAMEQEKVSEKSSNSSGQRNQYRCPDGNCGFETEDVDKYVEHRMRTFANVIADEETALATEAAKKVADLDYGSPQGYHSLEERRTELLPRLQCTTSSVCQLLHAFSIVKTSAPSQ